MLIYIQVVIAFFVELLSQTIIQKNNAVLFNCYILSEVLLYGFALKRMLSQDGSPFFNAVLVLAVCTWLLNIWLTGIFNFANYAYLLDGLLLGAACIVTIIQNLRKGIFPFKSNAVSLLLAGLAAYYFCDVPLLGLLGGGPRGLIAKPVVEQLFAINLLLAALKYSLISFAFLQHRKERTGLSTITNHER